MATDVHNFLKGFFALDRHKPKLINEFYIIGESYGGHYVPALANFIINSNK